MKKEKIFNIRIDKETMEKYKKFCKDNKYKISNRIRGFIELEIKDLKNKDENII